MKGHLVLNTFVKILGILAFVMLVGLILALSEFAAVGALAACGCVSPSGCVGLQWNFCHTFGLGGSLVPIVTGKQIGRAHV